jgi:hypothetical protein
VGKAARKSERHSANIPQSIIKPEFHPAIMCIGPIEVNRVAA